MNFSTEAIADIRKEFKNRNAKLYIAYDGILKYLQESKKFIVPCPSTLKIDVTKSSIPYIKMPYPIMAFEYEPSEDPEVIDVDNMSSKRILLAFDTSKVNLRHLLQGDPPTEGILVIMLHYLDGVKHWNMTPGFLLFNPKANNTSDFKITESSYSVHVRRILFKYNLFKSMYDKMGEPAQIFEVVNNTCSGATLMVIQLLVLLNSKNVSTVEVLADPTVNNKRRLYKKLPFFDYKTLNIFLKDTRKTIFANEETIETIKQELRQHRLHSVRGHFKVRGNKNNGIVYKDYKLHTTTTRNKANRKEDDYV